MKQVNLYKDPLLWLVFLAILAAVAGFAVPTTASWFFGLWFTAGVTFAFALLVTWPGCGDSDEQGSSGFLSFPWRRGVGNLHRPNNQTTAVMLAIGLGTFLLVTPYNVRSALMSQVVQRSGKGSRIWSSSTYSSSGDVHPNWRDPSISAFMPRCRW